MTFQEKKIGIINSKVLHKGVWYARLDFLKLFTILLLFVRTFDFHGTS
jgi:hypothetical protein